MNATKGPAIEAYWVFNSRRGTPGFQRAHWPRSAWVCPALWSGSAATTVTAITRWLMESAARHEPGGGAQIGQFCSAAEPVHVVKIAGLIPGVNSPVQCAVHVASRRPVTINQS